jgi:hypothetical protein
MSLIGWQFWMVFTLLLWGSVDLRPPPAVGGRRREGETRERGDAHPHPPAQAAKGCSLPPGLMFPVWDAPSNASHPFPAEGRS